MKIEFKNVKWALFLQKSTVSYYMYNMKIIFHSSKYRIAQMYALLINCHCLYYML